MAQLYYKIINSRTFPVVLRVTLMASGQIGEAHIEQMLVFGFRWWMEKLYYRRKKNSTGHQWDSSSNAILSLFKYCKFSLKSYTYNFKFWNKNLKPEYILIIYKTYHQINLTTMSESHIFTWELTDGTRHVGEQLGSNIKSFVKLK